MILRALLALTLITTAAQAQQARIHHEPDFSVRVAPATVRGGPVQRARAIAARRAAIEREATKLRRTDGGKLTSVHRAYIEARLAEVNGALAVR